MTLEAKILRDLKAGQASASAVADTLRTQEPLVAAVLQRLEREGRVTTGTVNNCITVYRLEPVPRTTHPTTPA